jgi:hypothetical protein
MVGHGEGFCLSACGISSEISKNGHRANNPTTPPVECRWRRLGDDAADDCRRRADGQLRLRRLSLRGGLPFGSLVGCEPSERGLLYQRGAFRTELLRLLQSCRFIKPRPGESNTARDGLFRSTKPLPCGDCGSQRGAAERDGAMRCADARTCRSARPSVREFFAVVSSAGDARYGSADRLDSDALSSRHLTPLLRGLTLLAADAVAHCLGSNRFPALKVSRVGNSMSVSSDQLTNITDLPSI